MKNLNINCLLFEKYSSDVESGITFSNVNTMIYAYRNQENVLEVDEIKILLMLNWLEDNYDVIDKNKLDIKVRLSSPRGRSATLAEFSPDDEITKTHSIDNILCKNIGALKTIITVNHLSFPDGPGNYYLKVFVRNYNVNVENDAEEPKYDTQFITPIEVVEDNS
ncbi:MAG: hypothetical protein E7508_05975 [Ruminococcus sp.]|nr:hypothetical protein [Ruminococcus sp.]